MHSNKRLGQHFLKNGAVLKTIAKELDLQNGDVVVEIGSGHGELTDMIRIMNNELRIVGIEKDEELAQMLVKKMKAYKNIEIICGDALKILPRLITNYQLPTTNYKLVGNIPYYITGYLLRMISELPRKPDVTVLTIQKEVAERICAVPPKMNLLSASVQAWARAEILEFVPKRDFSPQPKVDSAIIRLSTLTQDKKFDPKLYYPFIRALFKQPRKTVFNNLKALEITQETLIKLLKRHNIDQRSRPQDLDMQTIKNIARDSV